MGHLFDHAERLTPQFDDLLAMYQHGQLGPHVDRCFRFDEAARAHHLHDRKAKGKVLLVP